ncbi:hypothetical protein FGO68_gene8382 [Halteria grandinella]|uniref:Uncharacterized protein n=1 Tax=Halteria grandinella TaxID=5974 RepID=A0A8J8NP22_HALGN|nr:hypothetical protein FGO68_gene8382 [Halteria grandinella]
MPDEAEPNRPRESIQVNQRLPPRGRPRTNNNNHGAEVIEEKIQADGYFNLFCFSFKPATRIQLLFSLTLFRAFNISLTLDVLTCVLYSILILMDEIQRSTYDIVTYIELTKTVILILHGAASAIAFKRCIVLRIYRFALFVKIVKSLMIISIFTLMVAQQVIMCIGSKLLENDDSNQRGICHKVSQDKNFLYFAIYLPFQVYFLYITHSFLYRGRQGQFDIYGNLVVEVFYNDSQTLQPKVAYFVNGLRVDHTNSIVLLQYPILTTMLHQNQAFIKRHSKKLLCPHSQAIAIPRQSIGIISENSVNIVRADPVKGRVVMVYGSMKVEEGRKEIVLI